MTLSALLISVAAALPSLADSPAVELHYTGRLTPGRLGSGDAPVKEFTLYCLYRRQKTGGSLFYLVEEKGGGGWPWPERFGRIKLDRHLQPEGSARIRLLQTHNDTKYPITVRLPLFANADKLADEATWTQGRQRYEVVRRRKVGEHSCYQVDVLGRVGRAQSVLVPLHSPVLLRFRQTVFIGRGERFHLQAELKSARAVTRDELARLQKPVELLERLQQILKRRPNQTRSVLSPTQLAAVRRALKKLEPSAEGTPLVRLVAFIRGDLESQQKRESRVAGLAGKIVGQKAPSFSLTGLNGQPIEDKEHRGKVVVLHFWEYRGEPLEEPYGQVGYLDYLFSKRGKLGVRVYGVAVNSGLAQADKTPQILRSVRKLKNFMNLSYPIAVDDGTLLKKFGDPRQANAKLPLWVVIDAAGKVRLYKSGFFAIRPDEGLRPLDELVIQLLREQRKR